MEKDKCFDQVVDCVKDYVLPEQCECSKQSILYILQSGAWYI